MAHRRNRMSQIDSNSKRHEGKYYVYWWDIWQKRKETLETAGEIHFLERDSGEGFAVKAEDLLPLLTEKRRTSRMRGNWGIRVLAVKPNNLVIEEPRVERDKWLIIPAKRI
jgi:hypothetical protein